MVGQRRRHFFFGSLLTTGLWLHIARTESECSLACLHATFVGAFWWHGLALILAGGAAIQALSHYFSCFNANGAPTAVASWIAATPLFVYVGALLAGTGASLLTGDMTFLSVDELLTPLMLAGVIVAAAGLYGFERISRVNGSQRDYRRHLVLLILFSVLYLLIVSAALDGAHSETADHIWFAAVIPYGDSDFRRLGMIWPGSVDACGRRCRIGA